MLINDYMRFLRERIDKKDFKQLLDEQLDGKSDESFYAEIIFPNGEKMYPTKVNDKEYYFVKKKEDSDLMTREDIIELHDAIYTLYEDESIVIIAVK